MPELPEVETIAREMRETGLEGATIEKAIVYWPRSIHTPEHTSFAKRIANQKIIRINRRGKYLVFTLSQDTLLVHLRMTGKFIVTSPTNLEEHSHERVRLYLKDGRILRYEDQRKFGKWYLLSNADEFLEKVGLEPLSTQFTLSAFEKVLKNHAVQLKPFLLNQKFVAGIGNIYADEALWDAKLHPQRRVNSLTKTEIKALHKAIILALQKGVDNIGTSLGSKRANYFSVSGRRGGNQYKLKVFRRDGKPCPRCQTTIIKTVVAQRGTHLCPFCQQLP